MSEDAHSRRVAVVGGGIAGLAAAERLSSAGAHTTLFEAAHRLGGVVHTVHRDGFVIEEGPDSILASKPEAAELCARVGLETQLIGIASSGALVMRRNRLVGLPAGMSGLVPMQPGSLFRSSAVSLLGALRAALEVVVPRRAGSEDESIESFMVRRFGRETFARLLEPLLSGIYAGDASRLSVAATFPGLVEAEREHGSVVRAWRRRSPSAGQPAFLSLVDGMGSLVAATESHLRAQGVEIRMNCAVTGMRLEPRGGGAGVRLTVSDGSEATFDGVVIAVPGHEAARLLHDVSPVAASALGSIEFVPLATISLGYGLRDVPRPLDASGYVVPRAEGRDVLACTWSSAKWPGRAPDGYALFRVFLGGARRMDAGALSDDELLDLSRRELAEVLNITAPPVISHVTRSARATPQYHIGHAARIEAMRAGLAGKNAIQVAGNFLEGVGLSDCVRAGRRAASSLLI